jgi:hypothetical protein
MLAAIRPARKRCIKAAGVSAVTDLGIMTIGG